jgi:hypothetical protein
VSNDPSDEGEPPHRCDSRRRAPDDMVRLACTKCERRVQYRKATRIERYGPTRTWSTCGSAIIALRYLRSCHAMEAIGLARTTWRFTVRQQPM